MAKGPVDLSRPRKAVLSTAAARRLEQAKPLQVCIAKKEPAPLSWFLFLRKMGLEPTQACAHKILSLARLPVPTLPRIVPIDSRRAARMIYYHSEKQKSIVSVQTQFRVKICK